MTGNEVRATLLLLGFKESGAEDEVKEWLMERKYGEVFFRYSLGDKSYRYTAEVGDAFHTYTENTVGKLLETL